MKILFFIESLISGGKERRLVELLKGLKKYPDLNYELVLTRKDIHYKDIFETGIKIHYIERKYLKKDPRLFYLFYRIASSFKPDIIHVWGAMVAFYAIPTKVLLQIPMINNQITNVPRKIPKGANHKINFTFSDYILANSHAGLEAYNAPLLRSKVIYNGFNFKRIEKLPSKRSIREKFNLNTKYTVVMVATFGKFKDYTSFIKAANIVLTRGYDVGFVCVGKGDYCVYEKMVIKDYFDKVVFLGEQKNVESIMNICDVGVLSTYTEGLSNAIMEFMSLAKPIIATDGGGTNELVLNNQTGFLVPPKSHEVIAEKIIQLLENPKMAKQMGQNGNLRIVEHFEINEKVNEFYKLYKECLI